MSSVRGYDAVVFVVFACSYGLAALCWLAVDVARPLVPSQKLCNASCSSS